MAIDILCQLDKETIRLGKFKSKERAWYLK
jgi:hypothetical protein